MIEGDKGQVEITRTEAGAHVTSGELNQVLVEVARDEHPEDRYAKAQEVAAVLYGTTRGKPNATNSMVHDVLTEIDLLTERDLEQVTEHPPLPWDEAVDGPQGQERVAT